MEAGNCSDGITKLETILAEDPAHIPSRFNLAVCFTRTAQANRAIDAYREILAQDEAVFEAQMNLAILLSEEDSPEEALKEFARAAELHPSDAILVLYQAQLLDHSNVSTKPSRPMRPLSPWTRIRGKRIDGSDFCTWTRTGSTRRTRHSLKRHAWE